MLAQVIASPPTVSSRGPVRRANAEPCAIGSDELVTLTYCQLAMAINAAGCPLSNSMTLDRAAALGAQGLGRWGVALVRRRAEEDRQSNLDGLEGRLTPQEWAEKRSRIWCENPDVPATFTESDRRAGVAHGLAYRLMYRDVVS